MMDQYTLRLEKIEDEIRRSLPQIVTRSWGEEAALSELTEGQLHCIEGIIAPALSLVQSGGKRWRPLLLLLVHELFGGGGSAICLTPLVELVHSGTLMVDDIEDKSDLRRGKPAAHIVFGEDVAINTGNLLYFLPTMCIDRSLFSAETKLKLYQSYAENLRRLHIGQGMDIQWHRDPCFIPAVSDYLLMCRYKTGALARMAAEFGVYSASGSDHDAVEMGEIAQTIGLAFQILDDVRNLTTGNPGKKRGDDIIEGKKSLPVILHCTEQPLEGKLLSELFTEARGNDATAARAATEKAIALLEGSGSIEKAQVYAETLLDATIQTFESRFPPSEARDLIIGMMKGFI